MIKETAYTDFDQLPICLEPKDIQKILCISKNRTYELLHRADFPVMKIGRLYRVDKRKFVEWLDNQNNRDMAA